MSEQGSLSIKNWSEKDRPREKLLESGSKSLSDSELLAILIGSGTRNKSAVELCREIYGSASNSLDKLGKLTIQDLMKFNGIGEAKAITIVAAMELGRRRASEKPEELIVVNQSEVVFKVMQPLLGELQHEEFWILLLNNGNKMIGKQQISKGGFTATLVDSRVVFKKALESGCVSIILVHNHPSGSLKPSSADHEITNKLKAAGNLIEIKVLDHIIITQQSYYSFADNGAI